MTEAQIKHMVDRFLGWHLPEDFRPDDRISFKRSEYQGKPYPMPTGTNLFDADQAEAMVRFMAEDAPATQWEIAYREEAAKFQQETRRTSEQFLLIERMAKKLRDSGHRSDGMPPCHNCDLCKWLADAEELMARPINVSAKAA